MFDAKVICMLISLGCYAQLFAHQCIGLPHCHAGQEALGVLQCVLPTRGPRGGHNHSSPFITHRCRILREAKYIPKVEK